MYDDVTMMIGGVGSSLTVFSGICVSPIFNNKKTVAAILHARALFPLKILSSPCCPGFPQSALAKLLRTLLPQPRSQARSGLLPLSLQDARRLPEDQQRSASFPMQIAKTTSEIRELRSQLKAQNNEAKPEKPSERNKTEERSSEIKKRNRRTAGEIARHYICSVSTCAKSYGSEGSLHQHMKLKHKIYQMFM